MFTYLPTTHKGVNQRSKYVIQVQQQRPESPTVTLTWHTCNYKVHRLHQRYILYLCTSGGVDVVVVAVDRFYIAPFSALGQTYCARM